MTTLDTTCGFTLPYLTGPDTFLDRCIGLYLGLNLSFCLGRVLVGTQGNHCKHDEVASKLPFSVPARRHDYGQSSGGELLLPLVGLRIDSTEPDPAALGD